LFTSQFTSLIAAVLFAVHPVHTEAVSTNSYMEAPKTWKPRKKLFLHYATDCSIFIVRFLTKCCKHLLVCI